MLDRGQIQNVGNHRPRLLWARWVHPSVHPRSNYVTLLIRSTQGQQRRQHAFFILWAPYPLHPGPPSIPICRSHSECSLVVAVPIFSKAFSLMLMSHCDQYPLLLSTELFPQSSPKLYGQRRYILCMKRQLLYWSFHHPHPRDGLVDKARTQSTLKIITI